MGRLRKNVVNEQKLFLDEKYFIQNPIAHMNHWNKNVFKNTFPIEIEIGCGKGKFIIEKAVNNPNINFIAIDKFPTILYKVLIKIKRNIGLNNIKIVCLDAKEINNVFALNEISKIYLNFSDPWPKKHHEKNRLTNKRFLDMYFNILKPNGIIEFKTDNDQLYNYTLNVLKENNYFIHYYCDDIYNDLNNNQDNIATEYEIKWKNKSVKIKKIIFSKLAKN